MLTIPVNFAAQQESRSGITITPGIYAGEAGTR